MKKTLWIAAAGALLLAGCKSDDVMDNRNYSGPKPEEVTQLPPPKTQPMAAPVAQAPNAYEPMTDAVSTGGVDSVSGVLSNKTSTYVVCKGDTLGKIAANHGVKLSALMAINNMDAKKAKQLRVGQKLTIPGAGAAVKTSAQPKAAATAAPKLDKDGFYVIQSGDNIPKIARRFKVKSADILAANNLSDADSRHLQIGQKIVIPGKSPATAVPAAPVTPAAPATTTVVVNTPADAPTPVTVTVTESAPAPAVEAAPVIDLSKTTIIEVTDESISLADFAKKQGVNVETLRQLNQGCAQMLRKGDPIVVPIKD